MVVGAGILGTMHALHARRRGFEVVHLDRDAEPRSASVRNFGLVWVSGRAPGPELDLAVRARELWEELALDVPEAGFRPDGSLTVVHDPIELRVIEEVADAPEADRRGVRVLGPEEVRRVNPALRGDVLAALHCERDAVVEPGRVLPALRARLEQRGGYRFVPGRVATTIDTGVVVDHTGERHEADRVVVCPGAEAPGAVAELLRDAPVQRVRLQMLQTEPLGERLATSLADGASLRYYPAFRTRSAAGLPELDPVARQHAMQLLVSQRASGALTVGDTHEYDEPFDFAVDERPYAWLLDRLGRLLGRPAPPVVRRWAGVYSQCLDHDAVAHRDEVLPGVVVVTGPGGRGMTLSPALGEQTFERWG